MAGRKYQHSFGLTTTFTKFASCPGLKGITKLPVRSFFETITGFVAEATSFVSGILSAWQNVEAYAHI